MFGIKMTKEQIENELVKLQSERVELGNKAEEFEQI